ncbi:MAG: hypothetical protein EON61_14695 [Alphaproteobacteria bacterium]|nr:MAG: hypothetical protein EON61_14695 [Alphaproteobacteria bacterium]
MRRAIPAVLLAPMLMAFQATPPDWTFDSQLRLGQTRQGFQRLAETLGVAWQCTVVTRPEVPISDAEVCRFSSRSRAVSALVAKDNTGVPRVVAYSVKGSAHGFSELGKGLREKLGAPTKQSSDRWGENHVWQIGGSWTVIHSACALQLSCLEVSQDMTARRIARSAGVFMPTYQPV